MKPLHPAVADPPEIRRRERDAAFIGPIPAFFADCCHGDTRKAVSDQPRTIARATVDHMRHTATEAPAP